MTAIPTIRSPTISQKLEHIHVICPVNEDRLYFYYTINRIEKFQVLHHSILLPILYINNIQFFLKNLIIFMNTYIYIYKQKQMHTNLFISFTSS